MAEVVIFTRPGCEDYEKIKELLKDMVIHRIVLDDQRVFETAEQEMAVLSGGSTAVPQVFINGVCVPNGLEGLQKLGALEESDKKFKNTAKFRITRIYPTGKEVTDPYDRSPSDWWFGSGFAVGRAVYKKMAVVEREKLVFGFDEDF